jgi:5-methylthioadenosine/S-adenosylhomocysteine deaminase
MKGLARNLDFYSDLPDDTQAAVAYEVFPFEHLDEMSGSRKGLKDGALKAVLIHVAEGKPTDASTHREFNMLVGQDLLVSGVIVIHGVALAPEDFALMGQNKVGLIWSPRSNIELYEATTNVAAARSAGILVAIAPDWSPTGSSGMLQVLNYAFSNYKFFAAKDLVQMATSIPARLVKLEGDIGTPRKGLYADLLVLRKRYGANTYESVVNATPADVQLVVVGGEALYGDPDLMKKLHPGQPFGSVSICGTTKAVYFEGSGSVQLKETWDEIQKNLDSELKRDGAALAGFECE